MAEVTLNFIGYGQVFIGDSLTDNKIITLPVYSKSKYTTNATTITNPDFGAELISKGAVLVANKSTIYDTRYFVTSFSTDGDEIGSLNGRYIRRILPELTNDGIPKTDYGLYPNRYYIEQPQGNSNWNEMFFCIIQSGSNYAIQVVVHIISSSADFYYVDNLPSNSYASSIKFSDYIIKDKTAVNFYRSSEPGVINSSSIELERGESSSPLEFTIVYDDGTFAEYDGDVEYSGDGLGTSYTIDNDIITIAGNSKRSSATITAKPVDYPELFTLIPLVISNPLGPYDDGGYSGPAGGGGAFGKDEVSDSIFGDLPPGSVDAQDSATGMYTRYLMNSSYLDLLGDWVWDPNLGLSLIQTAIKPFFNDPEQALISLISFPFQLSAPLVGISTRSQPCYFGHQPTGATFVALTTQSAQINWGTIDLQEYWGNFLDYSPHTKIELYLPWGTGFVNLDPGQCLPGTLTVTTNIELQRGSCVHNVVNSAGCVIGSYAGQCGKQIPLIASDIAAKRAGLVTAAAGALVAGAAIAAAPAAMSAGYSAGIASSGIVSASKISAISTPAAAQYRADVASSFGMKGAESALNTVEKGAKAGANIASKSSVASLKTPVSVQRNGGFTDGSAGMGIQYPYIILSRPEQNVPENYGHHFGYPSNVNVRLSNLRGYTEIGSIHLDSIPATNAELEELDGILKGGVIF